MCNCSAHSNQFFSAFSLKTTRSVNVERATQMAQEVKSTLSGPKGEIAVCKLEQGLMTAINEILCLQDRTYGNGEFEAVKAFVVELGKYPRVNIQDKKVRERFSVLITSLKSSAGLYVRGRKTAASATVADKAITPKKARAQKKIRRKRTTQKITI